MVEEACLLEEPKPGVRDTYGHGTEIFNILQGVANDLRIHLYRITDEVERNGFTYHKAPSGNIVDAFDHAIEANVDIFHLSHGIPEPQSGSVYLVPNRAQRMIDSGITLVAAAGNKSQVGEDHKDEIFHPARLDDAICVSGYLPRCTYGSSKEPSDEAGKWLKLRKKLREEYQIQGPFCSHDGCAPGETCVANCYEENWGGNASPIDSKPDVIAPVQHLSLHTDGRFPVEFKFGTSYAAPYITALVSLVLDDLRIEPTPAEIQEAVHRSRKSIDDGTEGKFDIQIFKNEIQEIVKREKH